MHDGESFDDGAFSPISDSRWHQPETFDWPLPGMTNTYLSDDNNATIRREINLPFTTNRFTAEQIAMVMLEEWRNQIWVQLTAKEKALNYIPGDVVNVSARTPAWGATEADPSGTAKSFWVMGMGLLPDATVQLGLMEYEST